MKRAPGMCADGRDRRSVAFGLPPLAAPAADDLLEEGIRLLIFLPVGRMNLPARAGEAAPRLMTPVNGSRLAAAEVRWQTLEEIPGCLGPRAIRRASPPLRLARGWTMLVPPQQPRDPA